MTAWRRGLGAAWLLASIALPALAASGSDFERRLEQANGLLGERARWDESTAIYRELLEEAPERVDVRVRLARVLSWSGRHEEALDEYARVLEREPGHPDAAVERAEVLSWIGRLDEAEAAFQGILAASPDDPRAVRGLARVYRWSERYSAADAAYARALALEEDREARAEWEELRSRYRPWVEVRSRWFGDSGDFRRTDSALHGSLYLDLDTRLFGHAGLLRVRQRAPEGEPLRADGREIRERDRAWDVALGLERRLHRAWLGTLEVGYRDWRHSRDHPYGRAALQFSPSARTSLQLEVARRDHFDFSDSRQALGGDVRGTYARVGLWRELSPHVEAYGNVQGGWLSDANQMRSAHLELVYRPWRDRTTWIGLGSSLLSYSFREEEYWSPNLNADASLSLRHRVEIASRVAVDLEASGGWGYVREGRVRGAGPQWAGKLGLEWLLRPWRLRLEGSYAQTQRVTAYTAVNLTLRVGREF